MTKEEFQDYKKKNETETLTQEYTGSLMVNKLTIHLHESKLSDGSSTWDVVVAERIGNKDNFLVYLPCLNREKAVLLMQRIIEDTSAEMIGKTESQS